MSKGDWHLRFQPEPNSGCLLWLGGVTDKGYGTTRVDGKNQYVHRLVLAEKLGRAIGEGLNSCHHCDVPPCGNPEHLYEGTQRQNIQDAFNRGRMVVPVAPDTRGSKHGGAKLTEADIPIIRQRLTAMQAQRAIAADYGVTPETISLIAKGKRWKHCQ